MVLRGMHLQSIATLRLYARTFQVKKLLVTFLVLFLPHFEASSQLGHQKLPRSRVERDTYYRQAKELGYRARSAFKLLQLDQEFSLFHNVSTAIDLCSAPGSWTQVLTNSLARQGCSDAKIVSVDIQPMRAVPGAIHIRGDITAPETERQIWRALGEKKTDIVVCDGAPDVTGLHELDRHVGDALVHAAIQIARRMLREGGSFVAKIFREDNGGVAPRGSSCAAARPEPVPVGWLELEARSLFAEVTRVKPHASRPASCETFLVCKGFRGSAAVVSSSAGSDLGLKIGRTVPLAGRKNGEDLEGENARGIGILGERGVGGGREVEAFVQCGSLE